jgi:uncharacterized protein
MPFIFDGWHYYISIEGETMQQIHRFYQSGIYMVIDVNSGAVHSVDRLTWDILEDYGVMDNAQIIDKLEHKYGRADIVDALSELDQLRSDGMLYSDDKEYDAFAQSDDRPAVVKAMCLHLSHDCNMRCDYCFASTGDFGGQRMLMTADTGRAALDFLVRYSGSRRHLEVDFFGGEPLMNFDVMKDIVEYGRQLEQSSGKHIRFTVTTNGIALDKEKIKYINDNMDNVVLSLDGRPAVNDAMRKTVNGKGTYDIILPKFKSLVADRQHGDYYIRGTFTKRNLDFAEDVMHIVAQGFDQVSVEPVVVKDQPYELTKDDLPYIFEQYDRLVDEYLDRIRQGKPFNFFHFMIDLEQGPCVAKRLLGCGAGSEYVAVTPSGDIYPCHQFVGDTGFMMGNVMDDSIDADMQRRFAQCNIYNKPECRKCWARFYCSGGCAANAYMFNGDIGQPYELYCAMEKKRIECALAIKAILNGDRH